MKESLKTRQVRSKEFFNTYFNGRVIDIGGGSDAVTENAEVFDFEQGDAQHILKYRGKESYDCVNSSHCLEHMTDVPLAFSQWWGLVKPGGYMVIVVPHEDLYEQGVWPSIFNYDHKATFRLDNDNTWSPVSYDLRSLIENLSNALIISAEIQDANYDHSLQGRKLEWFSRKIYKWKRSNNRIKKLTSRLFFNFLYKNFWTKSENTRGVPIDQTLNNALAQIQIVLQKNYPK
jgi:SAM-dependent methyltransferase